MEFRVTVDRQSLVDAPVKVASQFELCRIFSAPFGAAVAGLYHLLSVARGIPFNAHEGAAHEAERSHVPPLSCRKTAYGQPIRRRRGGVSCFGQR
jgi:hypothetical protein